MRRGICRLGTTTGRSRPNLSAAQGAATFPGMANEIITTVFLSHNGSAAAERIREVAEGTREFVDLEGADRRSGVTVGVRIYA